MTQRVRIGTGALTAAVGTAALGALMLPMRAHMPVATAALVLVLPVVAGVAVGGLLPGIVGVASSFFVYEMFFMRPYGTLPVGNFRGWVTLGVDVTVLLVVARVVASLTAARSEARRREDESRRLLDLSEVLLVEKPLEELLAVVVSSARRQFGLDAAVLALPVDGRLEIAAADGDPLSKGELERIVPRAGALASLSVPLHAGGALWAVTLVTAGRPVGLLAFKGRGLGRDEREMLGAYAAHGALAIERAQLREQASRAGSLEETDRFRRALLSSVSHDLRTPLASIKASVSTLSGPATSALIGDSDRAELLETIEDQTDHLDRLVTNLLDMSRIEAGVCTIRSEAIPVSEVVDEALAALETLVPRSRVVVDIPSDLPCISADHALITQVLVNLVENAARHGTCEGPVSDAAIEVRGQLAGSDLAGSGTVEISVTDRGPGVPDSERERIFEMFHRRDGGGRAGLGLGIAKAFVEAHGGSIRVESAAHGGARFVFSLPAVPDPLDSDYPGGPGFAGALQAQGAP
ncbi:MAG: ATP-binding protein [Actinomycetota bacterium]|nr:ATP-binding protein [Actinomycetota bacterium]